MTDERAALAARHTDDSYGCCVICREWVPGTDDEYRLVEWPCDTARALALPPDPDALARVRKRVEKLRRKEPWPQFITAGSMEEAARTANNNVVDDVLAIFLEEGTLVQDDR